MGVVLVRYGELALKSEPVRRIFEQKLMSNIHGLLRNQAYKLRRVRGRIFVYTRSPKRTAEMLSKLPGVVSCSPAIEVLAELDSITREAVRVMKKHARPNLTFAVRAKRHGACPFTSQEINEKVGRAVLNAVRGVRVDLKKPKLELGIEVWDDRAFIFVETRQGIGGLPVGTQGKVLVWFEGKTRDLEAARQMLKKGCEVELVLPKRETLEKAAPLLKHHSKIEAHILPAGELQTLLHRLPDVARRRAITALMSKLAKQRKADGIVFSEDATTLIKKGLEWLKAVDEPSEVVVLRPLVGAGLVKGVKAQKKVSATLLDQREFDENKIEEILEKAEIGVVEVRN